MMTDFNVFSYNTIDTHTRISPTWFLSGLLVSQLPQVIAATGVHRPILHQEGCVSVATPHIAHLLPVEEFTFPWLNHDLFINPTQA